MDVDYFYRSSPQYLASHGITGLPDEYYQRQYNHINSHELAGFGELTYHINDKLWLTTGMRYGGIDAQGVHRGRLQQRLPDLRDLRDFRAAGDDADPGRDGREGQGDQAVLQGQPVVQARRPA